MITFTVKGRPVGKERARVDTRTKRAYTPKKTAEYEEHVGWSAVEALKRYDDPPMFQGDVCLSIWVYVSGGTFADCDNYAKSICDGLQGVLFENDKQVSELHVKRLSCKRGQDRAEIEIERAE